MCALACVLACVLLRVCLCVIACVLLRSHLLPAHCQGMSAFRVMVNRIDDDDGDFSNASRGVFFERPEDADGYIIVKDFFESYYMDVWSPSRIRCTVPRSSITVTRRPLHGRKTSWMAIENSRSG